MYQAVARIDEDDVFENITVCYVIFTFIFRNREISVGLNIIVRLYFKFARNRHSSAGERVVQQAQK